MSPQLNAAELNALIQVSKTVNAHLELDAVLESIMNVVYDAMMVEACSLALIDDETGDLLFHLAVGEGADKIKQIRLKQSRGIVGWIIQSGRSTIVNENQIVSSALPTSQKTFRVGKSYGISKTSRLDSPNGSSSTEQQNKVMFKYMSSTSNAEEVAPIEGSQAEFERFYKIKLEKLNSGFLNIPEVQE